MHMHIGGEVVDRCMWTWRLSRHCPIKLMGVAMDTSTKKVLVLVPTIANIDEDDDG